MALVGMTDIYLHGRMNDDEYEKQLVQANSWLRELSDEVASADEARIRSSDEYRFMAHRHWNLYDSMYHSSFIATRLGVWRSAGQHQLHTLLATIGISIENSKQQFACMSATLKRKFFTNLQSAIAKYKLNGLIYPSFEKVCVH